MALGLAVNARGADHNRSGAYEADLSGEHDRLAGGEAHVAAAIETEDRAAVMDSLILCKFLRGVFTDPFAEWAALLSAVTGWDVDGAELRRPPAGSCWPSGCSTSARAGSRRTTGCPSGCCPSRCSSASGRVATLTPERLRGMIDGYYAARGLDEPGRPDPARPGRPPAGLCRDTIDMPGPPVDVISRNGGY